MQLRVASCLIIAVLAGGFFAVPENFPQDSPISIREFGRLFSSLSQPEGYFDSDNFISNEQGYLRVLPVLKKLRTQAGAYFGVGPDQNYSYIAELRPRLAIIMDIRRQNALQHLYLKALFELSPGRSAFLERLFGRRLRHADARGSSITQLIAWTEETSPEREFQARKRSEALARIQSWEIGLSQEDVRTIDYVARAFMEAGPQLQFTSYNRPARSYHPSYRQLLEATDPSGRQVNYLADEGRYLEIRRLHAANRILPLVGDFGAEGSFGKAGEELRKRGIRVTCLYVSNVEFYLFRGSGWEAYLRNLRSLQFSENACIIRAFAGRSHPHPAQVPGHYMTSIVQPVAAFLRNEAEGLHRLYWDVISRDYIPNP